MSDWMSDWDGHAARTSPHEWGVGRLEVVEGGPRRDWLAESRYATLEYRERELTRRELRLTITGYVLAASICLEVVLALVVIGYGNRRLPVPLSPAAVRGEARR
jgi:hypothetical protein